MPRYFIQAHLPEGRAIFVFGEFLEQPSPRLGTWVPAFAYSVEDPEGTEVKVDVSTTWAISEVFFEKARQVGWDMAHPFAPIGELEETMRQFRRLMYTPPSGD